MWAGKDPYANKTAARVIMLKVGRLPGRLQLVQTASPASMPGRWRGSDRAGGGALGGSHARGQATPSGAAVHWVQVKAHSRLPPLEGCPAEYQQLVDDCTRYDRHSRWGEPVPAGGGGAAAAAAPGALHTLNRR
jgi:hypothetical protein